MHTLDYRIAAVRIYDFLGSMRKAAKALGIGVASISRWSKTLKPSGWPSRGSKIIPAMEAVMKLALEHEPYTSAAELKQHLEERFDIKVSRQLVALVLQKKLRFSWKRTRKRGPRGSGWTDEKISEFKQQFIKAYNDGCLSSWDESSFDQRCRPVYGYAAVGKQAIVNVPRIKCSHQHHSLLMGMHMNGTRHHSLLTGSIRAPEFAEFVKQAPYPPGTVILLDNHSMHKTVLVREAAASKSYTLLNTPAYSPEFNPIEMVFGTTKNIFYKLRYSDSFGGDMGAVVEKCLEKAATPSTVTGCFRHVQGLVRA
jgi:transposase